MIEDSRQLRQGIEFIKYVVDRERDDFLDNDKLIDVLCILDEYIATHKGEINNYLLRNSDD